MKGPVMTSASSHRLRSAVNACAQPSYPCLTTSYLDTHIQCCSQYFETCQHKYESKRGKKDLTNSNELSVNKYSSRRDSSLLLHKGHTLDHKGIVNNYKFSKNQLKSKNFNGKNVKSSSNNKTSINLRPKLILLKKDYSAKSKLKKHLINSENFRHFQRKSTENKIVSKKFKNVIVSARKTAKNNKHYSRKNNLLCLLNNKSCKSDRLKKKKKCNVFSVDENGCTKVSEKIDQLSKNGFQLTEDKNERQEISKWQPKHVVTRRTAQIEREVRHVWENRVGSSKLAPTENVQLLFNDLELFPSTSQVSEMLECAQECSENPSANHLTFGDFYKLANKLYRKGYRIKSPSSPSKVLEKNVERSKAKFSRGMSKYEVFLGGSCNPTTWRTDFAIPQLESMNITYYNPQQVEEWRPELLEVEFHAKENATIMFFVLDNQTRGVSALIEVAYLAGNKRKLILVIQSYSQKNQTICDEEITQKEYEDLRTGQVVLQSLVERQGIPVFNDISEALSCTEKVLRQDFNLEELKSNNLNKVNSLDVQGIFNELDPKMTGKIFLSEACLAINVLFQNHVSFRHLQDLFFGKIGSSINGNTLNETRIDLDSFLKLINDFETSIEGTVPEPFFENHLDSYFDVYLGGTFENSCWRESIAIPKLQSQNINYFVPKVTEERSSFSDIEAIAMERSHILLFVITDTARSITAMAIAGHYIGKGANVVLCVKHLPEGVKIGNETLSESAVKDYNRGRMYLVDAARRSGISVFEDILEATDFVIEKCKN